MTKAKKYRFFYHYFKQKKCMSVHFKKQCMQCKDIVCYAPTQSKWNKTQPQLVIQGFASNVELVGDIMYIFD
jgi:hypothetical protein